MHANLQTRQPLLSPSGDIARANKICNDPSVLPGLSLGIVDHVDLTPLVENPRNHLLLGEHGGVLLIWAAPGVYDSHDFCLPEGRGAYARDAAQDVFAFVFGTLGARMLFATTPVENRASRMFNRILGFKSEGVHTVIAYPGAEPADYEYFVMERG